LKAHAKSLDLSIRVMAQKWVVQKKNYLNEKKLGGKGLKA